MTCKTLKRLKHIRFNIIPEIQNLIRLNAYHNKNFRLILIDTVLPSRYIANINGMAINFTGHTKNEAYKLTQRKAFLFL